MIEFIVAAVLVTAGTGGIVVAEARLIHTRILDIPRITAGIQADATEIILEKKAIQSRTYLTEPDVLFLTAHGWKPETPQHKALAARPATPSPTLPQKAKNPPKPYEGEIIGPPRCGKHTTTTTTTTRKARP